MTCVVPKLKYPTIGLIADNRETGTVHPKPPEVVIRHIQQTYEEGTNGSAVGYDEYVFFRVVTLLGPCTKIPHPI